MRLQRKRIEALNSFSSFVYGLKTQLGDQEGLGKILDGDKKTISRPSRIPLIGLKNMVPAPVWKI